MQGDHAGKKNPALQAGERSGKLFSDEASRASQREFSNFCACIVFAKRMVVV